MWLSFVALCIKKHSCAGVGMTLAMTDESRKMLTPLVSGITQTMKNPNGITKQEFDNALYEFILYILQKVNNNRIYIRLCLFAF